MVHARATMSNCLELVTEIPAQDGTMTETQKTHKNARFQVSSTEVILLSSITQREA